ncbi:VWFA domain-containing protein [Planctomycetales bacterium 10988]|nr:VWFA domain-containing protein [Planctomycetales bacterium 10988]
MAISLSRLKTASRSIPSWALSLVIHLLILCLLAIGLGSTRQPPGAEADRPASIVLAQRNPDGEETFLDEEAVSAASGSTASEQTATELQQQIWEDLPGLAFENALPSDLPPLTGSPTQGTGVGSAVGEFLEGSGPGKSTESGKGSTQVFGVTGTGSSFVYVFDRSGSMGGSGRNALAAAKNELIGSLASLEPHHQFQIIFYNQTPLIFNPAGQGRLAWANESSKELARRFVSGVPADGFTDHMAALKMALNLQPDSIFFLTDADLPRLSPPELIEVQRRNGGRTSIHVIEFGRGPATGEDNFLRQLARQNSGQYGYVDIFQLP